MHFPSFFILPLLFSTGFGQQLISLNSFNGNNIPNPLKVDTPFSIYVSAHSDDDIVLKEVFVISGNNSISLYDLKTNYFVEKFGQLERYVVHSSAYLTSPLATLKLAELTGVMYLSSPEQVADDNFYVYDIDQRQDLNLAGLGYLDLTILFLNTNMATNPPTSTLISNWTQNSNSRVYLYQGVPYDLIFSRSHIFSNPMMSDNFYWYFPNVETFSISTVSFYIRAYNGTASFRLEPGSTNLAGTTTTDIITTGFYMKPVGVPDSATQINVKKDDNDDGFTGCNIVGHVPNGGSVSFDIYNGDEHYNRTVVPKDFFEEWSTHNIGNKIVISSTNAKDGVFYVQYFIIQGVSITTTVRTVPSSTQPAYPDTTTKESRGLFCGLGLIILMILLRFF